MRAIEIFRLRRQRHKPAALAALARHAALPPEAARRVIDQASGGGKPSIPLPDERSALACIAALNAAGFVARFAPAPDFAPGACAEAALATALPHLPPAVQHAIGALLLQDQHLPALEHALLHLRQHTPCTHPTRQKLEQTATACGLLPGAPSRA